MKTYDEYPPDHYELPFSRPLTVAYIVDIDGTCADHSRSGRDHYEYDRVDEDDPIPDVIRVIDALAHEAKIIFVSGRDESCREKTEAWIDKHFCFDQYELYMRPAGDRRPDTIIKRELFDKHLRNRTDIGIAGVFDDRNRVVEKTWRYQLGLTTFHVADHDF